MKLVIQGNPIPWQRARRNGSRYYDPQYKDKLKIQESIKEQLLGQKPQKGPLKLIAVFKMPVPTSYSKKRALRTLKTPHSKRPDLSNLIKFLEDALNGIVWGDDAFIYEYNVMKVYGETPQTVFAIEAWKEEVIATLPGLE